jgi:DNA-binding XRE family transcriptional regulator
MTQTIKTPGGETLVVLPLDEFEALRDAADHAKALAALARGEEEKLSAKEAIALAEAPTPIGFWRRKRGMTQVQLAKAVGISQSYLAGLETGARHGDAALVKRLAGVLRLPIEDLISE